MTKLALLGFLLLGQVANLLAVVRMLWAIITGSRQAKVIALSYDQLGNSATNGHEDETISSRAGRAAREQKKWACVLCRLLDWFDPNHCEKSIERQFLKQRIKRREQRLEQRRVREKRRPQ